MPLSNTSISAQGTVKITQTLAQRLASLFLDKPIIESRNQDIGKAQAKIGF